MDSVVRLMGLCQGYGRIRVIDGLNLDIGAGVMGLLGPNGAGKSTLLHTLATVSPPVGGTISIDGVTIDSEPKAREARRHIGYLPQHFGYLPSFTVCDFVYYSAWLRELPAREIDQAVNAAIGEVGLADRAKSKLKSLSGGMLQRAGIAASVVGRPPLILLDEPTVGLDPRQRLDFRALIRSLSETSAVVLSTHLVEDIGAICDDIVVMERGQVLFRGSPDMLCAYAVPGAAGDSDLERGYISALDAGRV
ncbi:ATP-binding cassette domain-containing protein [Nonomuraea sp. NPDC050022]|uniref:ATP-binding cassette domain-containing protein n=1 Tax=Nonomuraea sp. NPDC050022 TaxID=3364358 RepID=UPI0037877FA9